MNNITHTNAKLAVSKLKRLKLDWVNKRVDIVTSYIVQQESLQAEHEALKRDIARYFVLSKNPTSNTNPNETRPYIEWANELYELEKQILSKVDKKN